MSKRQHKRKIKKTSKLLRSTNNNVSLKKKKKSSLISSRLASISPKIGITTSPLHFPCAPTYAPSFSFSAPLLPCISNNQSSNPLCFTISSHKDDTFEHYELGTQLITTLKQVITSTSVDGEIPNFRNVALEIPVPYVPYANGTLNNNEGWGVPLGPNYARSVQEDEVGGDISFSLLLSTEKEKPTEEIGKKGENGTEQQRQQVKKEQKAQNAMNMCPQKLMFFSSLSSSSSFPFRRETGLEFINSWGLVCPFLTLQRMPVSAFLPGGSGFWRGLKKREILGAHKKELEKKENIVIVEKYGAEHGTEMMNMMTNDDAYKTSRKTAFDVIQEAWTQARELLGYIKKEEQEGEVLFENSFIAAKEVDEFPYLRTKASLNSGFEVGQLLLRNPLAVHEILVKEVIIKKRISDEKNEKKAAAKANQLVEEKLIVWKRGREITEEEEISESFSGILDFFNTSSVSNLESMRDGQEFSCIDYEVRFGSISITPDGASSWDPENLTLEQREFVQRFQLIDWNRMKNMAHNSHSCLNDDCSDFMENLKNKANNKTSHSQGPSGDQVQENKKSKVFSVSETTEENSPHTKYDFHDIRREKEHEGNLEVYAKPSSALSSSSTTIDVDDVEGNKRTNNSGDSTSTIVETTTTNEINEEKENNSSFSKNGLNLDKIHVIDTVRFGTFDPYVEVGLYNKMKRITEAFKGSVKTSLKIFCAESKMPTLTLIFQERDLQAKSLLEELYETEMVRDNMTNERKNNKMSKGIKTNHHDDKSSLPFPSDCVLVLKSIDGGITWLQEVKQKSLGSITVPLISGNKTGFQVALSIKKYRKCNNVMNIWANYYLNKTALDPTKKISSKVKIETERKNKNNDILDNGIKKKKKNGVTPALQEFMDAAELTGSFSDSTTLNTLAKLKCGRSIKKEFGADGNKLPSLAEFHASESCQIGGITPYLTSSPVLAFSPTLQTIDKKNEFVSLTEKYQLISVEKVDCSTVHFSNPTVHQCKDILAVEAEKEALKWEDELIEQLKKKLLLFKNMYSNNSNNNIERKGKENSKIGQKELKTTLKKSNNQNNENSHGEEKKIKIVNSANTTSHGQKSNRMDISSCTVLPTSTTKLETTNDALLFLASWEHAKTYYIDDGKCFLRGPTIFKRRMTIDNVRLMKAKVDLTMNLKGTRSSSPPTTSSHKSNSVGGSSQRNTSEKVRHELTLPTLNAEKTLLTSFMDFSIALRTVFNEGLNLLSGRYYAVTRNSRKTPNNFFDGMPAFLLFNHGEEFIDLEKINLLNPKISVVTPAFDNSNIKNYNNDIDDVLMRKNITKKGQEQEKNQNSLSLLSHQHQLIQTRIDTFFSSSICDKIATSLKHVDTPIVELEEMNFRAHISMPWQMMHYPISLNGFDMKKLPSNITPSPHISSMMLEKIIEQSIQIQRNPIYHTPHRYQQEPLLSSVAPINMSSSNSSNSDKIGNINYSDVDEKLCGLSARHRLLPTLLNDPLLNTAFVRNGGTVIKYFSTCEGNTYKRKQKHDRDGSDDGGEDQASFSSVVNVKEMVSQEEIPLKFSMSSLSEEHRLDEILIKSQNENKKNNNNIEQQPAFAPLNPVIRFSRLLSHQFVPHTNSSDTSSQCSSIISVQPAPIFNAVFSCNNKQSFAMQFLFTNALSLLLGKPTKSTLSALCFSDTVSNTLASRSIRLTTGTRQRGLVDALVTPLGSRAVTCIFLDSKNSAHSYATDCSTLFRTPQEQEAGVRVFLQRMLAPSTMRAAQVFVQTHGVGTDTVIKKEKNAEEGKKGSKPSSFEAYQVSEIDEQSNNEHEEADTKEQDQTSLAKKVKKIRNMSKSNILLSSKQKSKNFPTLSLPHNNDPTDNNIPEEHLEGFVEKQPFFYRLDALPEEALDVFRIDDTSAQLINSLEINNDEDISALRELFFQQENVEKDINEKVKLMGKKGIQSDEFTDVTKRLTQRLFSENGDEYEDLELRGENTVKQLTNACMDISKVLLDSSSSQRVADLLEKKVRTRPSAKYLDMLVLDADKQRKKKENATSSSDVRASATTSSSFLTESESSNANHRKHRDPAEAADAVIKRYLLHHSNYTPHLVSRVVLSQDKYYKYVNIAEGDSLVANLPNNTQVDADKSLNLLKDSLTNVSSSSTGSDTLLTTYVVHRKVHDISTGPDGAARYESMDYFFITLRDPDIIIDAKGNMAEAQRLLQEKGLMPSCLNPLTEKKEERNKPHQLQEKTKREGETKVNGTKFTTNDKANANINLNFSSVVPTRIFSTSKPTPTAYRLQERTTYYLDSSIDGTKSLFTDYIHILRTLSKWGIDKTFTVPSREGQPKKHSAAASAERSVQGWLRSSILQDSFDSLVMVQRDERLSQNTLALALVAAAMDCKDERVRERCRMELLQWITVLSDVPGIMNLSELEHAYLSRDIHTLFTRCGIPRELIANLFFKHEIIDEKRTFQGKSVTAKKISMGMTEIIDSPVRLLPCDTHCKYVSKQVIYLGGENDVITTNSMNDDKVEYPVPAAPAPEKMLIPIIVPKTIYSSDGLSISEGSVALVGTATTPMIEACSQCFAEIAPVHQIGDILVIPTSGTINVSVGIPLSDPREPMWRSAMEVSMTRLRTLAGEPVLLKRGRYNRLVTPTALEHAMVYNSCRFVKPHIGQPLYKRGRLVTFYKGKDSLHDFVLTFFFAAPLKTLTGHIIRGKL